MTDIGLLLNADSDLWDAHVPFSPTLDIIESFKLSARQHYPWKSSTSRM